MNTKNVGPGAGSTKGPRTTAKQECALNNTSGAEAQAPQPDRGELQAFIETLFKHATSGTWASLRSFPDKGSGNNKAFEILPVKLNGDLGYLVDKAYSCAKRAAKSGDKIVFCPPVATFTNKDHAREEDLAEGLVLSIECDKHAQEACNKLQELLGPPTIVVKSGGEWINPETGELEPKLHDYYRLKIPARDQDTLKKLKQARELATEIVGGDASNVSAVHPIRWPGSLHRKEEPKLCCIDTINAEAEIDLDQALDILRKARPHSGNGHDANAPDYNPYDRYEVQERRDLDKLLDDMVYKGTGNGGNVNITELVYCASMISRGVPVDEVIETLRDEILKRIPESHDWDWGEEIKTLRRMCVDWLVKHPDKLEIQDELPPWVQNDRRIKKLPVSNGGTPLGSDTERKPKPQAAEPKQYDQEAVLDLWKRKEPPALPQDLLPKVIEDFAFREAEVTGCDPAGLAMGALTVSGAAITDLIQIQPKEYEPEWKQSARLWVALGGPVSAIKSAQMDRCTNPYSSIDEEMREEYRRDMDYYETLDDEKKKNVAKPLKKRLCIEDTTPEALQEIMQDNLHGQLMVRDELSGFFGGMDKYSGNRGGSYDRGFWLKAYNGGRYSFDRVKRGSGLIKNCGVSVLGGIQEDTLRTFVNEGIDDGLIQRMLLVILRSAVIGKNVSLPPHQYNELINKLYNMQDIITYHFDKEAEAIRYALEQKHLDLAEGFLKINKKLHAHIGKYNGIFARLCLIWHCIKNIDTGGFAKFDAIDGDTAQQVAKFLHEFLLPHAISFYIGVLGVSDQHDTLLDVAGYILAHKLDKLTTRHIQRGSRKMRDLTKPDTDRIFQQLQAYGWLNYHREKNTWYVNPAAHEIFAAKAEEELERRQRERATIIAAIG